MSADIIAFDQLHDQGVADNVASGIGRKIHEPVNMRDVRMIQRGKNVRFAAEARQVIGIAGDGREQDLDRHVAAQRPIARPIDFAHAPRPEGRDDFIGPEAGSSGQRHLSWVIEC
jgi:hypothetical protein